MVDPLLNRLAQRERLLQPGDHDDDLARVEHGRDADGQSHVRHLRDIVVEEARVGGDGVVGERLDARAGGEGGAGLVKGNVPVFADAAEEAGWVRGEYANGRGEGDVEGGRRGRGCESRTAQFPHTT